MRSLELLKTAQSGFSAFHRDRFTSLKDAGDRLLGTSMAAEWTFLPLRDLHKLPAFLSIRQAALQALVSSFCGPSDVGTFSPSVQATLFQMVSE